MSVLAIIPARGGSKAIPRKNVAAVGGKPLIAWTIEAALSANCIERCIVSTDDEQIAVVAKGAGAEVPFMRPPELAQDDSPSAATVLHALKWLDDNERYEPDFVILLQPTSPARSADDIDHAMRLALEKDADAVVSVCLAKDHPYWVKEMKPDGLLQDFVRPPKPVTRRQDLPPAYVLNGAIYLGRRSVWLETGSCYTEKTYGYVMPVERSLDIDTPWDLHVAGMILKGERYR